MFMPNACWMNLVILLSLLLLSLLTGIYFLFIVIQFSNGNHFKHPASLGGISIFVCFATALASLGVAFAVVPRQVMPSTGLLLVYEWTFVLFFFIFGVYLQIVYEWGRATVVQSGAFASRVENSDYNSGKGFIV